MKKSKSNDAHDGISRVAVIYARYSSHAQTEQSIEGQLHDAHAFADREGYVVLREYCDRGISGKSADARPEFLRMVEDAARHEFGAVLVWKLDRFARNRFDAAIYRRKLQEADVRLISVTEHFSDGPEAMLLEAMMEAMNEYSVEDLKQKIKRGQRESLSKGRWAIGRPPFGYSVDKDKHLVADPCEAPLVKEIFRRYLDGEGTRSIAKDLEARGIRTKRGGKITMTTLATVLGSSRYTGHINVAGIRMEIPQLVSQEDFDMASAILQANKKRPAAKDDYPLSGVARCGLCGAPMVADQGRGNGGTYHYYTCANKKKGTGCTKKPVRCETLEEIVTRATYDYVLDPDRADFIAERVCAAWDAGLDLNAESEIEEAIRRRESEINVIMDRIIQPGVSNQMRERYEQKIEELTAEIEAERLELAKVRGANSLRMTPELVKAWLQTFLTMDPTKPETQNKVFKSFVRSVICYDERVIVYYNIQDPALGDFGSAEMQEKTPVNPGSDLTGESGPDFDNFEPLFVFPRGGIGIIMCVA